MIKRLLVGLFLFSGFFSFSQSDTISTNTITLADSSNNFGGVDKTQDGKIYRLKPGVDLPITLASMGWTLYAFTSIYDKDPSTEAQINRLNVNNINGFDRWAAKVYHENAANTSDLFFYGSMPLPFLLLLDKSIRKDAGKIGFLYLEAMSATGVLYTSAVSLADRYRPYAYNKNAPLSMRMAGGAHNSFFAGHVALVGTASFFMAKVFSDYHPDSKARGWLFALAGVTTGATGYLRHRSGRHFPSDVLLGTAVGTLSGILVPHFHKVKPFKDPNLSVMPFTGQSTGLALVYRFNKK